MRWAFPLFHFERQVEQPAVPLHLQYNRIVGLEWLHRIAKRIHRIDRRSVQGVDDIAGLHSDVGNNEIGGSAQDQYAGWDAESSDLGTQLIG